MVSIAEEQENVELYDRKHSPEESCIVNEEKRLVQNAVDKLPEKMKVCVLLFYMEELSVTEMANLLKLPEGTVKSRLYKARKILVKELENVL